MQLSIIIVNWNSVQYTRNCIASIRTLTNELSYEILVVDNASSDNSFDELRRLAGITLIASAVNLGFAEANNLALRSAIGTTILFLNPDTHLVTPAIDRMYHHLSADSTTGAVGCRLLNEDMTVQTSCVQPFPRIANQAADAEWLRRRFPRARIWGMGALYLNPTAVPVPVEAVSGACIMVKRRVLKAVGDFSNEYFMYGEDIDLCYKIHEAGWTVLHVPEAVIVHYGGRSSSQRDDHGFQDVVMRESVYKFLRKTRGSLYAGAYRGAICLASIARLSILMAGRSVIVADTKKSYLRMTFKRWCRILRWSVGYEAQPELSAQAGLVR